MGNNKFLRFILVIVLWLLFFAVLLTAFWAFLIRAYLMAALLIPALLLIMPVKFFRVITPRVRIIGLSALLVIYVILSPAVIGGVNSGISLLCVKLSGPDPANQYTLREKSAIYGLNIMMGLTGLLIYPEAAIETLYMALPTPKDGVRVFNSGFPSGSANVKKAIKGYVDALKDKTSVDNDWSKPIYVHWRLTDYPLGRPEARYALTLNPCHLYCKVEKRGNARVILAKTEVRIEYPKEMKVTLINKPLLKLDEGLFWVCQKAGWMFPYTAAWVFEVQESEL